MNFLDILFWIDENGKIQTDLYIKPTDARSYLSFDSCHPNHIFAGIVYTQALRIRRIVSVNDRLAIQLNALAKAFLKCKYPKKLVNDIIGKVQNLPRVLKRNNVVPTSNNNTNDVIMVTTYGSDKPLQDIVDNLPNKEKLSIRKVYKTAPSLKQMFFTPRKICLGPSKGVTNKCNRKRCLCCNLVSQSDKVIDLSGKNVKTANGNCTNKIVLYHLKCKLCVQPYIGKTVQMLSSRMCGHRSNFFELIRANGKVYIDDDKKDEYIPGLHLYNNHGLKNFENFDNTFEVTLKNVPLQTWMLRNIFGYRSLEP